jgi:hypothetical protein
MIKHFPITNTNTNEIEKFAIYWCYNRAMDYVEKGSPHTDNDLIVNGVNIGETIKNLLERLIV